MTIGPRELVGLAAAALAGVAVGFLYVAALWRAVRRITSERVARTYLTGLLVRASLAAAALVAVALDHPERAAAAALGFVVARPLAVRLVGARTEGSRG